MASPTYFSPAQVARAFNQAASRYDQHAVVQHTIGDRLIQRLSCLHLSPSVILDVGSGTGKHTRTLQSHFCDSLIMGLDISLNMLQYAQRYTNSPPPTSLQPRYLCADMAQLPFRTQSLDLIFSNFTLQWANALPSLLCDFKRMLTPRGGLFFTTVGPQTLYELRDSFTSLDAHPHVHPFVDLHDLGDLLLHAGFKDPVIDREIITVHYKHFAHLLRDLKNVGTKNFLPNRRKGLTSPGLLKHLEHAYATYKTPDYFYPVTYEVLYGHAWSDGIARIPAKVF